MDKNNYHYFYVLECSDTSFYAGYTTDILRRTATHNHGKGAKYTKARLPVKLKYYELYQTKREAMQREYAFKQLTRAQKIKQMRGE